MNSQDELKDYLERYAAATPPTRATLTLGGFLTTRLFAIVATTLITAAAIVIAVIGSDALRSKPQSLGLLPKHGPSATAPPISTTTPTPSPSETPSPTPTATPTPQPVAFAITSFGVTPADIYQTLQRDPKACFGKPTLSDVNATISSPNPITSVVVYWSFTGNSGSGAMDQVSPGHWNTGIGGFPYPTFSFQGNQTISYYVVATDSQGQSLTSVTVTNTLHPISDCYSTLPPG